MRGGPGEAQIELDRRMIGDAHQGGEGAAREGQEQRSTQRRARERSGTFRVSLVGYTNAGKSTLFNALVKARAYAADQLFATLDTTTRQLYLERAPAPVGRRCRDTVGFIRDLPHKLVEAFQATLQEAADADLLLHVVDAASPVLAEQMAEVERVLRRDRRRPTCRRCWSSTSSTCSRTPQQPARAARRARARRGVRVPRVFVSARTGAGPAELRAADSPSRRRHAERLEPGATRPQTDTSPDRHDPAADDADDLSTTLRLAPAQHSRSNDASSHVRPARPRWPARCATQARRPGSLNNGGRNDGPPDLDELWRDFNRKLERPVRRQGRRQRRAATAAAGNGGGDFQPDMKSAGIGVGLIAGVVVLIWLGSGFFIVQEGQQAVVTSFGKYSHTVDAGFQWRLPYPFQAPRDRRRDAAALGRGRPQHRGRRPPACATRRC